jgi:predicted RecA/RadA family phage recombinase
MASNRTRVQGKRILLTVTDGGVNAGDPCLVGQMAGVVEGPKDASNNAVVVREGVYSLSVKGVTTAGAGSAVAQGDKIYYVPGNTPKLSKAVGDAGAIFFGWAKGAVNSAATATIEVILAGGSHS